MVQKYFLSYIENLKSALDEIDPKIVEEIIGELINARNEGRQVFILGNGGSASTASHFACDLAKGTVNYKDHMFKRFRALSLTDNMALITAIGNDISYDDIFVEQLKNYLKPKDVVIAISASGNSRNILKGIDYAKSLGAKTIGILGFGGGKAKNLVDIPLIISSRNYGISEDFHIIIEHIITQIIRRVLNNQKERVIFLDRDGIINHKPPDHTYITRWEDFEFIEEIFEVLKILGDSGYRFVIVTNQQGVGKGLMSINDLEEIHQNMVLSLEEKDIKIDGVYFCPHTEEENCLCRKPKPGLLYKAMNELTYLIDIESSFLIGDSVEDVLAGNSFGCKTILVNRNGNVNNEIKPDFCVKTIRNVVDIILK